MKATGINRTARLLVGSLAVAVAATLAVALAGRPMASQATTRDGDVVLGYTQSNPACTPGKDANCENTRTEIRNTNSGSKAFEADATGDGAGIIGTSDGATGVAGQSDRFFGVFGLSNKGEGVFGRGATNGVHGQTFSSTHSGVVGDNAAGGYGVFGSTTSNGIDAPAAIWGTNYGSGPGVMGTSKGVGVLAEGPVGLQVRGAALFSRSGKLTIARGSSKGKVTGINLTSSSLVLATIQGNVAGVYVQGVTIVAGPSGSFTVHLNKAAPSALTTGWFVVN